MTRNELKSLIREMIKGQWDQAKPGKGGRRYIPKTIEVPKLLIQKLNNESNGPHIRVITNKENDEKILLISPYLKIALEESHRGRTSRDTLLYQNRLLKKFNEIFEGYSMFKVILKKSLENTKMRQTPFGEYFTSKLIILDSTKEKLIIANPSTDDMMSGLDEENI